MKPTTRIIKICPNCGSESVGHDAAARWNVEKQDYEISSIQDNAWCDECGYDGDGLDEKEIELPQDVDTPST